MIFYVQLSWIPFSGLYCAAVLYATIFVNTAARVIQLLVVDCPLEWEIVGGIGCRAHLGRSVIVIIKEGISV